MVSLNDVKIGTKLLAGFLIIVAILVVIAAIGYLNLQTLAGYEQKTMEAGDNVAALGKVNAALEKMRGDIYRYIYVEADRGAMKTSIDTQIATVNTNIAELRKTELTDKNKQLLAEFDTAWAKMQTGYLAIETYADQDDTEAIDRELAANSATIAARTATLDATHALVASYVDEADAMAEAGNSAAASASMIMIIATIVGAIVAIVLGLFLTRSITGPLNKAINMLQELGKGHLGTRLKMGRKDEIGVMADTMDKFADDLKEIVETMKKISAGDLSSEPRVVDAQDEINPALKQTIDALRGLVSETNKLTKEATEGRLDTRGNASKFAGGYKDIIEGINATLDAVIGPLNVAAEYVDRISKGEIPQKIKDDYKGDFNEIKNNLNQCIDGLQGLVEANAVLQRMAVNDYSKGVEGKYQGLFEDVKTAVNQVRDRV
ncbi:MAG: MCP four helix bundle domain-containing protein, partial [Methanolinea sp.]|nr:MCP four helix bundle domain-containing protein [Methanolinea sp.]